MDETQRGGIALEGVSKRFGKHEAVRDVSLSIREGEFFSLLGPSGCGKTTTLRMVAGFEVPDAGRIYLQGEDVTTLFSNRRPVNMVFQQYALFPHMSIYDNVAFGLEGQEGAALRARRTREGDAADRRARGSREAQAPAALGRPAAAGCSGARARQLTRGPAARRAARRARREAAQADAAAAEGDPARRRHDLRLRHARPGRGARDVRPDRGHERRPGRADRQPARDLHAAVRPLSWRTSSAR